MGAADPSPGARRVLRVAVASELEATYLGYMARFGWTVTARREERASGSALTIVRIPYRADAPEPERIVRLELECALAPELARAEAMFWCPEQVFEPLAVVGSVAEWLARASLALVPLVGGLLLVDGPDRAWRLAALGWAAPVLAAASLGALGLGARCAVAAWLRRRPAVLARLLHRVQESALRRADRAQEARRR